MCEEAFYIYIYIYIYIPPLPPFELVNFPTYDCPMPFIIRTLILIKSGMDVEIFIHYYI